MPFNVNDRIKINPSGKNENFIQQAAHRGEGRIESIINDGGVDDGWYWVTFGDYRNNYPGWALQLTSHQPMQPDFSLEEIELGNDIYASLSSQQQLTIPE